MQTGPHIRLILFCEPKYHGISQSPCPLMQHRFISASDPGNGETQRQNRANADSLQREFFSIAGSDYLKYESVLLISSDQTESWICDHSTQCHLAETLIPKKHALSSDEHLKDEK